MAYLASLDKPRVSVSFKRSSTKDAGEGWDITVEEGATEDEANRVMDLAKKLREQALEALNSKYIVNCGAWQVQRDAAITALRERLKQGETK